MTTVGYGDCFPITVPGKIISTALMFTGVVTLALPITVLGSNFAKMVDLYEVRLWEGGGGWNRETG